MIFQVLNKVTGGKPRGTRRRICVMDILRCVNTYIISECLSRLVNDERLHIKLGRRVGSTVETFRTN